MGEQRKTKREGRREKRIGSERVEKMGREGRSGKQRKEEERRGGGRKLKRERGGVTSHSNREFGRPVSSLAFSFPFDAFAVFSPESKSVR